MATRYTYNRDRQLVSLVRPDGSSITPGYDGFGRLSSLAIARGTYSYGYDPITAQIRSIAAPGGIGLAYSYAGPLLTSVAWSGRVTGSVAFGYDGNFRLASETVAGSSIAYSYDTDGLLTRSGPLTLQRNPQTGFLTGTTLGVASETIAYNEFGEPVSDITSAAGSGVFSEQMVRDSAGRISRKTETIGGVAGHLRLLL